MPRVDAKPLSHERWYNLLRGHAFLHSAVVLCPILNQKDNEVARSKRLERTVSYGEELTTKPTTIGFDLGLKLDTRMVLC